MDPHTMMMMSGGMGGMGMGGMGGMGLGGMGLGGMGMMNPMMNPMMMGGMGGMGMNPMMMGGMGGMGMGGMGMMNPMMMGGMGMMNPMMMGMGGMGMLGGGLGSGAYGDALVYLDAKVSPWRIIRRLRHGHGGPADGPRNGHGWIWVWDGRDALGIMRGKWVAEEEPKIGQPGASVTTLSEEEEREEEKGVLRIEEKPTEEKHEDGRTDTSSGGRIAAL